MIGGNRLLLFLYVLTNSIPIISIMLADTIDMNLSRPTFNTKGPRRRFAGYDKIAKGWSWMRRCHVVAVAFHIS
jgi:hypothetical protein